MLFQQQVINMSFILKQPNVNFDMWVMWILKHNAHQNIPSFRGELPWFECMGNLSFKTWQVLGDGWTKVLMCKQPKPQNITPTKRCQVSRTMFQSHAPMVHVPPIKTSSMPKQTCIPIHHALHISHIHIVAMYFSSNSNFSLSSSLSLPRHKF